MTRSKPLRLLIPTGPQFITDRNWHSAGEGVASLSKRDPRGSSVDTPRPSLGNTALGMAVRVNAPTARRQTPRNSTDGLSSMI